MLLSLPSFQDASFIIVLILQACPLGIASEFSVSRHRELALGPCGSFEQRVSKIHLNQSTPTFQVASVLGTPVKNITTMMTACAVTVATIITHFMWLLTLSVCVSLCACMYACMCVETIYMCVF